MKIENVLKGYESNEIEMFKNVGKKLKKDFEFKENEKFIVKNENDIFEFEISEIIDNDENEEEIILMIEEELEELEEYYDNVSLNMLYRKVKKEFINELNGILVLRNKNNEKVIIENCFKNLKKDKNNNWNCELDSYILRGLDNSYKIINLKK